MDFVKLEGFIEGIESERNLPNPSHSNLARLTALALKELIQNLSTISPDRPKEKRGRQTRESNA